MNDGVCTKQFPKEFKYEIGHDNALLYIAYRRRAPDSGGETAPWIYRQADGPATTGPIDYNGLFRIAPDF